MSYRIGELAERVGMTVEGLRYYEREGLVEPAGRTSSGYRFYGDDELERLRFVRAASEMGFTLKEVGELLEIRDGADDSCDDVHEHLVAKRRGVRRKIELLRALERDLDAAIDRCEERIAQGGGQCPVLEELGAGPLAVVATAGEGQGGSSASGSEATPADLRG